MSVSFCIVDYTCNFMSNGEIMKRYKCTVVLQYLLVVRVRVRQCKNI